MSLTLTGLADKVALVTGAGRRNGIGRSIALALAASGSDVIVTGSGRPSTNGHADEWEVGWRDVDSVADEIRALGRRALATRCDVTSEAAVRALDDLVGVEFGRLDFVVNNAAASRGADRVPVIELAIEDWDKVLDVNLKGTFLLCRMSARRLLNQGVGGAIINISSIAAKLALPNVAAYACSKAAVQALTVCLARELNPFNVRVNAICPGTIDTSRMAGIPTEEWQRIISDIPLGRLGSVSEIAAAVVFLCSDSGAGITGQAVNIDGGRAMTP